MAEDLIPILTRFHREVFLPDFERILRESFDRIGREMNMRSDEICERLDRLIALRQVVASTSDSGTDRRA